MVIKTSISNTLAELRKEMKELGQVNTLTQADVVIVTKARAYDKLICSDFIKIKTNKKKIKGDIFDI